MERKKPEKRKRIVLAMQPAVHDKLRKLAEKRNLSMSRVVEHLVMEQKQ
jgi:HD-like signal output (HDOD) protein